MELLARPDGETIELSGGRSSVISRAKMLRLQRNQTVKGLKFESLVMPDGLQNSDKRIHG